MGSLRRPLERPRRPGLSIYSAAGSTTGTAGSSSALSKRLIVRRLRSAKGKQRAAEPERDTRVGSSSNDGEGDEEVEDEEPSAEVNAYSQRTNKGWKSRRERAKRKEPTPAISECEHRTLYSFSDMF